MNDLIIGFIVFAVIVGMVFGIKYTMGKIDYYEGDYENHNDKGYDFKIGMLKENKNANNCIPNKRYPNQPTKLKYDCGEKIKDCSVNYFNESQ